MATNARPTVEPRRGVLTLGGLWGAALLALAPGCAGPGGSPAPAPAPRPSGLSPFLGDISGLRPSPRHANTLVEFRLDLREFDRFYVEPVVISAERTAGGRAITPQLAERLAAEFRKTLSETLAARYHVVESPGPGIARVRCAVTQVMESRRDPVAGREITGGGAVEAEIVDDDGRRLLAVIESDVVEQFEPREGDDAFRDTTIVFRHWAARLNVFLEAVRTGDLPVPPISP